MDTQASDNSASVKAIRVIDGTALTTTNQRVSVRVFGCWGRRLQQLMPPSATSEIVYVGSHLAANVYADDEHSHIYETFEVRLPDVPRVETLQDGHRRVDYRDEKGWSEVQADGSVRSDSWSEDPGRNVLERIFSHQHPPLAQAFLEPHLLLKDYSLIDTEIDTHLGRRIKRIRTRPAYTAESVVESGSEDAPLVLPGCDEAIFAVDTETGCVLSWYGYFKGELYEKVETTKLRFDLSVE